MAAMTPFEAASLRTSREIANEVRLLAKLLVEARDLPAQDETPATDDVAEAQQQRGPKTTIARTFRLDPPISEALDVIARMRFGNNRTRTLSAAIQIAAQIYSTDAGRSGTNPSESLVAYALDITGHGPSYGGSR